MYPDNNQQPNHAEYLNQIAPKSSRKSNILQKRPILTAGIGAAILIIIFIIINGIFSGSVKPTEQLAARLLSTADTSNSATANIKSSQLRALNSDLKIYLTNTIRDITPILTTSSINIKSLDKKTISIESNADLLSRLEDARLNVVYDRTYAREMAYQLDTVLTLMLQINNSTSNKTLKSFLSNARTNLEPIQKQFSDFNLATS